MTLDAIKREICELPIEQRKALISFIADTLTEPTKKHSLLDFEGVGKHLADGEDAQDYVNRLRDEWDKHP